MPKTRNQDAYYNETDEEIIEDGGVVRVPMTLMDQRRVAVIDARNRSYFDANDHRPHFGQPNELENFRRNFARQVMIDRAVNGWKTMGRDQVPEPYDPDENGDPDDDDMSDQTRRKTARDNYIKRTTNGWRTRMPAVAGWGTQPPGPGPGTPGPMASNRIGAGDSHRRQLSFDEANMHRNAAYDEMCARQRDAWRTPPR